MPVRMPTPVGARDAAPFRYTLDGVSVVVRLRWLSELGSWYADFETASGVVIATGCRVTPGVSILLDTTAPGWPGGQVRVAGPDPYRKEQLGTDVVLAYFTRADLGLG